jgi:hypothetical protein
MIGLCLMMLAQAISWLQYNGQFVWETLKNKFLLTAILIAVPNAIIYWYSSKILFENLDRRVWMVKVLAQGTSYLVFPIMTWMMMKESPLTIKNLISLVLSLLIILVQLYL